MTVELFSEIDLRLTSGSWPFADQNRAKIDGHWAEISEQNPSLWDGQILRAHSPVVRNGVFSAQLVTTRFAAYIAWRDWGFPDKSFYSVFGSAVIRGNDGGLLFGHMADNTSSPDMVYPCGGSLEPGDVNADGSVDIFASTDRELAEETGLDAREARLGGDFIIRDGQLISVTRIFEFDLPTTALRTRIEANIAAQTDPELKGVHSLHSVADIDRSRTKPYAIKTAEYLFSIK